MSGPHEVTASGYVVGQLSRAFLTATTHENRGVRSRADRRAARWMRLLESMASGEVVVGSRAPLSGLPAWVTPAVVRGGFATGAAAEGDLEPDELDLAKRIGVPPHRRPLFGYYLGDAGMAELHRLLDQGTYAVHVPEDAVLLFVAWLLRVGDRAAALDLLDVLRPFVDRLRFTPRVAAVPSLPTDHVFRESVESASSTLRSVAENERLATQREAVTVWGPFSDRVLALWCQLFRDGVLDVRFSREWVETAMATLAEYAELAAAHRRCTKHRQPKENLAILLAALNDVVDTGALTPRRAGFVKVAITSMVAKRGQPGSSRLIGLREVQAKDAAMPTHRELASLVADRLVGLDPVVGLVDPAAYVDAVTADEAAARSIPAGVAMPGTVTRVMSRTRTAPVETLLAEGIVPSAEVLAELVPPITATVVAAAYEDDALARLVAATYRAFSMRRSLLLLNLEKQVQLRELPWMRAVRPHATEVVDEAGAVAMRIGGLALDYFPGTILPNPLLKELGQLCAAARYQVPLVEELAADIFMGQFSAKFGRAAELAWRIVGGGLYAAYYGIEPGTWTAEAFGAACLQRAGEGPSRWSVAANGKVIEQAQILTTHNLAALVALGVRPRHTWYELAHLAFSRVVVLLKLASKQPWPLATIKDAAYAWRQTVFYLSLTSPAEVQDFLELKLTNEVLGVPGVTAILDGLAHIARGGRFGVDGRCPGGRQFLGWSTVPHWLTDTFPARADAKSPENRMFQGSSRLLAGETRGN